MGGERDKICVRLLGDKADLAPRLASVDAGKALCALDEDRERLLAVIESSFGTFAPFNKIARAIIADKLAEDVSGA